MPNFRFEIVGFGKTTTLEEELPSADLGILTLARPL